MKSIIQISKNIGVSKVSIYKLIRKPEFKNHIHKIDNKTLIDEAGEQIIVEYYNRQKSLNLENVLEDKTEKQINILEIIKSFENQLAIKDKQISALISLLNKEQENNKIIENISVSGRPKGLLEKLFKR